MRENERGRSQDRPRSDVAVVLASRVDSTEQTVCLVIRSGGEVERVRRSRRAAVAEADAPEPVDRDRHARPAVELTGVREVARRRLGVGVDPSVAEVADEEVTAERTE